MQEPGMQSFRDSVLDVVRGIPKGSVLSYAEVATKAGFSGAVRAVGTIMRKNFDSSVPCHRVVRSDGGLGEYNRGGAVAKRKILENEGVRFDSSGRIIT